MDENFRKRLQKTLYSGELEPGYSPLALTDLAVEFFHGLAPNKLGHVDLETASAISVHDGVSPSSVAMSMLYAKRLQRKRSDYISKLSSSELFIISMMMASKYLYDEGVDEEVYNDEWAEKAGLEKKEVNDLEMDFLDAMDWELFINKEDFEKAMVSVERQIALKEGMKRGWFSYTDLDLLMDEHILHLTSGVGKEWLKMILVCSAAYFAGAMIMVGSTVLVTNMSLALGASGPLPAPHTTFPPIFHSQLALIANLAFPASTSMPAIKHADKLSTPELSGFNANSSLMEVEEDHIEEEEESATKDGQVWQSGMSVVDTILSQLMAVLTIKSHLLQFVTAVSDSYATSGNTSMGNRSASRSSRFASASSNYQSLVSLAFSMETEGAERCSDDLVLCQWLAAESGADVALGSSCARCGKKLKVTGCDMDSGSGFLKCSVNQYWECGNEKEQEALQGLPGNRFDHHRVADSRIMWPDSLPGSCSRESLAYLQNLFPDVTVGFSTSMPPLVFAT